MGRRRRVPAGAARAGRRAGASAVRTAATATARATATDTTAATAAGSATAAGLTAAGLTAAGSAPTAPPPCGAIGVRRSRPSRPGRAERPSAPPDRHGEATGALRSPAPAHTGRGPARSGSPGGPGPRLPALARPHAPSRVRARLLDQLAALVLGEPARRWRRLAAGRGPAHRRRLRGGQLRRVGREARPGDHQRQHGDDRRSDGDVAPAQPREQGAIHTGPRPKARSARPLAASVLGHGHRETNV